MTYAAALTNFRAAFAAATHNATPKTPEPMDEARPLNLPSEDEE